MLVGTCFTLFVVPTMYMLLGKRNRAQLAHKNEASDLPG